MSANMSRLAALAAFVLAVATAAPASAKPADCLFVFEGEAFIDGTCELKTADSGSFRIEADGYFVELYVEGEGKASGRWNGEVRASEPQQPLHTEGPLTRNETCWINHAAKLCVWQPGERTQPKPVAPPHREARAFASGASGTIGSWNLVAVAKNGKLDHCYGFVPGDAALSLGRLKVSLGADDKWSMSGPSVGTEAGYRNSFDIKYHTDFGMIDGEVDPSGQRMNLTVTREVLEALAGAPDISLGYAPDLTYRLKKSGQAFKALQDCRAQYLKQW